MLSGGNLAKSQCTRTLATTFAAKNKLEETEKRMPRWKSKTLTKEFVASEMCQTSGNFSDGRLLPLFRSQVFISECHQCLLNERHGMYVAEKVVGVERYRGDVSKWSRERSFLYGGMPICL